MQTVSGGFLLSLPLRMIETCTLIGALVCISVWLVDKTVASIHRSASASVHHVHLVSAVRLRYAVWHVAAGAAAQSLVGLAPAKPFPATGLN